MKDLNLQLSKVLFLLTTICIPVIGLAKGGSDGGGGGAYVCRNKFGVETKNTVADAELTDLWEARMRPMVWEKPGEPYKLDIPYTDEDVDLQIFRALNKLSQIDPVLAERVGKDIMYVRGTTEQLSEDVEIEVPADAKNIYRKKNCPLEGMMYFDGDTKKLSMKPEIFSKLLNNTNIAAAWAHEGLYKTLREVRMVSMDSTYVRRINACLFATNDCFGTEKSKVKWGSKDLVYQCTNNQHSITMAIQHPNVQLITNGILGVGGVYSIWIERINGKDIETPWVGQGTSDFIKVGRSGSLFSTGGVTIKNLISRQFPLGSATLPNVRFEVEVDKQYNFSRISFAGASLFNNYKDFVNEESVDCKRIQN